MKVQVLEGRFVGVPAVDGTGMDRRAFGEFIGRRGELASYAFGWTTGSDPHVARISIGIGADDPGGGTFHAVVIPHEDTFALSLVDEPFEQVPQGGPDLTRDQALAHEALRFVWLVADRVLERDRRSWWMRHWLLDTLCIQTPEVSERREPIRVIVHDANEGVWQLIGTTDAGNAAEVGHLFHAVDDDPTLIDVLDLPSGHSATRTQTEGPWTRHRPRLSIKLRKSQR